MVKITLAVVILCCSCSAMEIATDAALLADLNQTQQLVRGEDTFEKYNFILGENPSQADVNRYFAGAIGLNTLIHREWTWLPRANKYRVKLLPYYQGSLIGLELLCIGNNYRIGVNVKF